MQRILIILFSLFLAFDANAQTTASKERKRPLTRILFIFDASFSMSGKWQSDQKIIIARRMLREMLDSLKEMPDLEVALRVYGHQSKVPPQDCDDTRLEVGFAKDNISKIQSKLSYIQPKGTTPIARSLEKAGGDFPDCPTCRNIIILITDGIEECDGDPCAISKALQAKGIILKPFVIGIGTMDIASLECIGTVFDASSEESFKSTLNYVISQALNNTTAQVNLLDINGIPSETNNEMTFLDHLSKKPKYNFIHTLNTKGLPDTLELDHLPLYDLIVHTIPPVRKDSIQLIPGKHTIIPVDAPQGYLTLKVIDRTDVKNLQCRINKHDDCETIHVQNFQSTEKYLIGKYDLEILTLPRIKIENIDIAQSKTTTVEVAQPGTVNISMKVRGYGTILTQTDKGLEFVCNLDTEAIQQTLLLQPGNYLLVFRHRGSSKTLDSVEKIFNVQSGKSTFVNAY
ncbi:MAG: VWA domain-containing protein [Bacteroidetes bacterium]|nr:VWA domain-containing protein [Bacteroidota bacterium]MBU1720709.1 VWA domain-containing protein [Bacteroidota bacterium]